MKKLLCIITVIFLISFYISASKAAIINVPEDYATIQNAIDASLNGDKVVIQPGIYCENIDFKGKAIELRSKDPNNADIVNSTIIDGDFLDNVVRFENGEDTNSIISGVRITNGSSTGIYCHNSSPSITNCKISENFATNGGIYCVSSSPSITNCTINGNFGTNGGICCVSSSPSITNCTISKNYAYSDGGGIY